jgi:hypothetical protein
MHTSSLTKNNPEQSEQDEGSEDQPSSSLGKGKDKYRDDADENMMDEEEDEPQESAENS